MSCEPRSAGCLLGGYGVERRVEFGVDGAWGTMCGETGEWCRSG